MAAAAALGAHVEQSLLARNDICRQFFTHEAPRLALACREMAQRFLSGGRLLAFGRGAYATDAQHVAVEFVHPVIVGKRALPALDLSLHFAPWLDALVRPEDMVMGFGPPDGDEAVTAALALARERQAMTFALPGLDAWYAMHAATSHPFMHQEVVEILYHTLWETVHVFFEHRELGHDVGDAGFLYPFLGSTRQDPTALVDQVGQSIAMKEVDSICEATLALRERLHAGGKLIVFGNGGSATDANDFALDCIDPPSGYRVVPAISLSLEAANISAIANDVGSDVIFLRQLIAHAQPDDVAIAISTSGGSRNVIAALAEARKRRLLTIALLGYDGGEIVRRGLADIAIVVRSDYIPRIQEVQASIYHVMRESLEVIARE
jgi:D-sedoheptulose 7-phosphate isomerase